MSLFDLGRAISRFHPNRRPSNKGDAADRPNRHPKLLSKFGCRPVRLLISGVMPQETLTMTNKIHLLSVLSLMSFVLGCAGVGVVATSDPQQKLADARHLFSYQSRPLIAERLIREAMEICQQSGNQRCLADSYQTYGLFFRSRSIESWETVYRRDGFLDQFATYDTRFEKSLEYLWKAVPLQEQLQRFDALTNAYLNIAVVNEIMGRKENACSAFAKSLQAHTQNIKENPNADVIVPEGYSSFEEFLAKEQERAGCT